MGAHIGGFHCHTTYRKLDANFRGLTALFGHMGVELDPVKEGEEERKILLNILRYINPYENYYIAARHFV
ncbi:alpha-galactosidase [Actinobacillus equuli]|nr:alpha-galactosidase [Actinobacillus equuli]